MVHREYLVEVWYIACVLHSQELHVLNLTGPARIARQCLLMSAPTAQMRRPDIACATTYVAL